MSLISSVPSEKRTRTNSIIVNTCQRGNPVLNFLHNVPWEHGNTLADYEIGKTACALFLSLRYHKLHPNYIYERLKELGRAYKLRILLILVDTPDHLKALRELTRVSLVLNFTVILSWSNEEAARYLETFKSFEHKPADAIMAKKSDLFLDKLHACLCQVRAVSKSDSLTLASHYNTFTDIANATKSELLLCAGFGERKAQRLVEAMSMPFDSSLYKGTKDEHANK